MFPTKIRKGRYGLAGVTAALALFGIAGATPARAESGTLAIDPNAPDWDLCRAAARDLGRTMALPDHLLNAISVTETGITPLGSAQKSPWPWTINVAGRGMRFPSKSGAVLAARRLRKDGHLSMDVGCMQVNLKYHPRAFTSLEEAFDPLANMTYAATFLTKLKKRYGSWESAIRRYHSHRNVHNVRYGRKVQKAWAVERNRQPKPIAGQETAPAETLAMASIIPTAVVAASAPVPISVLDRTLVSPVPRPRQMIRLDLRLHTSLSGALHLADGRLPAMNLGALTALRRPVSPHTAP